GLGVPNIPLALVPGHIGTKNDEQLRKDVIETTAQQVIENLTQQPPLKGKPRNLALRTSSLPVASKR
ncbi:MAG: hypothetical protein WCH96_03585, partial [Betaproteobacteria bacterium]